MVDWQELIPTIYYQSEDSNLTGVVTNLTTEYTTATILSGTNNVPVDVIYLDNVSNYNNISTEYYLSTPVDNEVDLYLELKLYTSAADSDTDTVVDVTISDDKRFTFISDVFSTVLGELSSIAADVEIDKGVIHNIVTDIFNSNLVVDNIATDIFNTDINREKFSLEAQIVPGTVQAVNTDIFSTGYIYNPIVSDIRTWSLFTGDFFLTNAEFKLAQESAWVDVVDYLWDIDIDNTYFMVDDTAVSGTTFSGIANGYRVFYNPPSDFDNLGVFTYTIHTQNIMGDILEQDYNLLYGFDVNFNKVVEWGPNNKVDILTKISNKAYCKNTAAESFYFVTKDYEALNLGSSILPSVPLDLGSEIKTQDKVFYYGGTYQITVSGIKDYAGNELSPIVYSFTIENPTN